MKEVFVLNKNLGMSVVDVANELGISRPTVYELLNRADFPKIRVGRRWIIPRQGLENWLEREAARNVGGVQRGEVS
mgnify:CR=1 FL=1